MPIRNDILDHEVLGREFKKGLQEGRKEGCEEGRQQEALTMLRRLIEARFGAMPASVEEQLAKRSADELEELGVRVLKTSNAEELLS